MSRGYHINEICFYFIIIARDRRSLIKREEETETMKYIDRRETEKTESTAKPKDIFGHTEVYLAHGPSLT